MCALLLLTMIILQPLSGTATPSSRMCGNPPIGIGLALHSRGSYRLNNTCMSHCLVNRSEYQPCKQLLCLVAYSVGHQMKTKPFPNMLTFFLLNRECLGKVILNAAFSFLFFFFFLNIWAQHLHYEQVKLLQKAPPPGYGMWQYGWFREMNSNKQQQKKNI